MIKLDFQNFMNMRTDDYAIIRRTLLKGVSSASEIVDEFEEKIANYLNIDKDCVLATNSGTSALHLALIGAGVKKNDYVLLPTTTFVSTANVVKYIGAKIVFADIDIYNWCISHNYVEAFYKSLKKKKLEQKMFVIPVDLYGCIINYIEDYMLECDSCIIIDAAESFGKLKVDEDEEDYDFICFSFNGNKIITTGAGGLLIGNKAKIKELKHISTQAKKYDGFYDNIGYNYRMAGINAALGLIQLKRIDEFLEKKRHIKDLYSRNLDVSIIFQKDCGNSSNWLTAILFPDDINIEDFKDYLYICGIETRRIFTPLHLSKSFKNNKSYPNAEYLYNHGLCLPSSTLCTNNDILYVCEKINKGIKNSEFKIKR